MRKTKSAVLRTFLVCMSVMLCACCSSTWLHNCKDATPLDVCLSRCAHPNVLVECKLNNGNTKLMPCADCCVLQNRE